MAFQGARIQFGNHWFMEYLLLSSHLINSSFVFVSFKAKKSLTIFDLLDKFIDLEDFYTAFPQATSSAVMSNRLLTGLSVPWSSPLFPDEIWLYHQEGSFMKLATEAEF